jgi:hypothetical protein
LTEKIIGFYPSRPFWALEALDLKSVGDAAALRPLMEEIVLDYRRTTCHLQICRDGKFMFRVHALEEASPASTVGTGSSSLVTWWSQYLDVVNCLNLLFESAVLQQVRVGFDFSEITPRDVSRMMRENNQITVSSLPADTGPSSYYMAQYRITLLSSSPESQANLASRLVVPRTLFERVIANLESALTDPRLSQQLATVARSVAQYKIGNFTTSLTLSWFVIEAILAARWERYLDSANEEYLDGERRISSDRRRDLVGADYPISVVTNFLELGRLVPFAQFKAIGKVRRYRNKVVHQDPKFECSADHCEEALRLALDLITQGRDLTIDIDFSYSVMGA